MIKSLKRRVKDLEHEVQKRENEILALHDKLRKTNVWQLEQQAIQTLVEVNQMMLLYSEGTT